MSDVSPLPARPTQSKSSGEALVSVIRGPADYGRPVEIAKLVEQTLAALDLPEYFVAPGGCVVESQRRAFGA